MEEYASAQLHRKLIRETQARIDLQQRLKRRVRNTRDDAGLIVPPFDPHAIRVEITDGGPFRPPPLSEEDLRDLMRRFPPGSLDGLGVVHLGPASPFAYRRRFRFSRDPHTDTPAGEVFPGIWGPFLRGHYFEHDRSIHLYAHIHSPGITAAGAAHVKLRTLVTFAHEASHHFDFMFRTRGDRWLMDFPRDEEYATRRAFKYVTDFVVPWLQERYPDECAAFQAWAVEHGGVPLRLELFADEHAGAGSALEDAFDTLVDSVSSGNDPALTKIRWAGDLCESFGPEDAYRVLEDVLLAQPDHVEALVARSRIDARQGQSERGEATLRAVLSRVPDHLEAWQTLTELYQEQQRWEQMAAAATQQLSLRIARKDCPIVALEDRAHAWLALQRWDLLAADVQTMCTSANEDERLVGDVYLALMNCHLGQFVEALALSLRLLANDSLEHWSAIRAVRFECAHRLGRPDEAGVLDDEDLALVKRVLPDWYVRLEPLVKGES